MRPCTVKCLCIAPWHCITLLADHAVGTLLHFGSPACKVFRKQLLPPGIMHTMCPRLPCGRISYIVRSSPVREGPHTGANVRYLATWRKPEHIFGNPKADIATLLGYMYKYIYLSKQRIITRSSRPTEEAIQPVRRVEPNISSNPTAGKC